MQQALLKVWNECEQEKSLPPKVERILVVVARKWGNEYPGSTIGILGQDAIEICKKNMGLIGRITANGWRYGYVILRN